jgi:hypothetical protein
VSEASWHSLVSVPSWRSLVRPALRATIAAAGVLSIIGSGGGFMPDVDVGGCCLAPAVSVVPDLRIAGVGDRITFEAQPLFVTAPVRYRWRRNGVDIPGADGLTYTLPGANLADDTARFEIVVEAANGSSSAAATLLVSPGPPVLFEDADFAPDAWSVATDATPSTGGPTLTATQALAGGDPGAYRALRYDMTVGPSVLQAFHTVAAGTYDPAVQGALYVIDYRASCIKTGAGEVDLALLLEQGGRRYASPLWVCSVAWMQPFVQRPLRAEEFRRIDGPPCAATEACPDFGPGGAPLRVGLFTAAALSAGAPAVTLTQGVDNWRVALWRR